MPWLFCNTVKPLLSRHPWELAKCLLNRECLLNRGLLLQEIRKMLFSTQLGVCLAEVVHRIGDPLNRGFTVGINIFLKYYITHFGGWLAASSGQDISQKRSFLVMCRFRDAKMMEPKNGFR